MGGIEGVSIPGVVRDSNSKTAIIIRKGKKYVYLVAMKSGKLTLTKQTFAQFDRNGYKELEGSLDWAVRKYLAHSGGLTDTAKKELVTIQRVFGTIGEW